MNEVKEYQFLPVLLMEPKKIGRPISFQNLRTCAADGSAGSENGDSQ